MGKKKKQSAPAADAEGILIAATNKNARRNFEIVDTYEAGIMLKGSEVKSIRAGGLTFKDAHVREKQGAMYLIGAHISPYTHAPVDSHEPERMRKLLLHKREIEKISGQLSKKGLTLIPLKIYFKRGYCKVEIGVGRGKKLHDKRDDLKSRQAERDMARAFRGPKQSSRSRER